MREFGVCGHYNTVAAPCKERTAAMRHEVMEIQRALKDNPMLYQVMKLACEVEESKVQEIALRMLKGELNKEADL